MRIPSDFYPYLSHQKFSDGYGLVISEKEPDVSDRFSLLTSMVQGKSVLHVGFADHQPLIEEKVKNGKWLHGRLARSASKLIGVDINEAAVSTAKKVTGLDHLLVGNILDDAFAASITTHKPDVVILGELLEHIDNPVDFLTKLNRLYGGTAKTLIITVPNFLSLRGFINALRHKEIANSDHRYYFSPMTLAKVVNQAGVKPTEYHFCESDLFDSTLRNKIKRMLLKRFPAFRDTLVIVGEFSKQ